MARRLVGQLDRNRRLAGIQPCHVTQEDVILAFEVSAGGEQFTVFGLWSLSATRYGSPPKATAGFTLVQPQWEYTFGRYEGTLLQVAYQRHIVSCCRTPGRQNEVV